VKEVLSHNNIEYTYFDITSGMLPLKNFLRVRDRSDSHKAARENGRVGIPTMCVDDAVYVVADAKDAERLVSELGLGK